MSNSARYTALLMGFCVAVGNVQPATAAKGVSTKAYCTELVVKKNITDTKQFKDEVHKCYLDPTTYK
jgi:hypothetical protein